MSEIDTKYIAHLARISINDELASRFARQFKDIISYIEHLSEIDTTNVMPTAYVVNMGNVFREDSPQESLDREEALANAPDKDQTFFKVPKIIE